jgi:hypothetical protein
MQQRAKKELDQERQVVEAVVSKAGGLVEEQQCIDIRRWHRERLLEPDKKFTWYWEDEERVASVNVEVKPELVILTYEVRVPDEKSERKDPVLLTLGVKFSACNYGGRPRPWFICPIRRM